MESALLHFSDKTWVIYFLGLFLGSILTIWWDILPATALMPVLQTASSGNPLPRDQGSPFSQNTDDINTTHPQGQTCLGNLGQARSLKQQSPETLKQTAQAWLTPQPRPVSPFKSFGVVFDLFPARSPLEQWPAQDSFFPSPLAPPDLLNLSSSISQSRLWQVIDILNFVQQAELENFFGEACLEVQPVQVNQVDPKAAILYTMILSDRLGVILSLPGQPLHHYSTPIRTEDLNAVLLAFRAGLVTRSRRDYLKPGQQLYDWLIRPALSDLQEHQIETLVFVLDGPLRNVPMSALHDGQHFLIEQYGVALTPSLELLAPQPLAKRGIKVLAAGLTQARDHFAPLTYVGQELDTIAAEVAGESLRDEAFTQKNLQHELTSQSFSVVHIATHGQFSFQENETFLLAWDGRIRIRQLAEMIEQQKRSQRRPIELLILSACETATGNHQAALGLAGMAVKAGASSTVASLWSISDESTAVLMRYMYEDLKAPGMPKVQALRQAQIALIQNPRYQHPFYWSAFVLLGNWL
jgi:CHAT domain-containing protein